MDIAVIGSGVSGISAAHALIEKGLRPTILDVGESLDPQRVSVVDKLRNVSPELWSEEDYDLIRQNNTVGHGELPKKVHFGSNYIYAHDRPFARLTTRFVGRAPFPTFAKGGFSNIWGAAVLPTDACDMADWPISPGEMAPYFRKVAKLLPLCGGAGTLETAFPAYRDTLGDIDPGPQGQALLDDLKYAEPQLTKLNVLYGKARLAIHTMANADGVLPCSGCGECFVGCVRGSIFSTVPMLERLVREGHVAYQPNAYVERIQQDANKVSLEVVDPRTAAKRSLAFDAVFVAAGPINTTRLLLQSRRLYDHPILLKESQKFVVPMLRRRSAPTAAEHPSITLASAFLEVKVPSLSDHWVHVQVIPMNRLVMDGAGLPGMMSPAGRRLWRPVLRRLMMGWCGLHSDHSSQVRLQLRQDSTSDREILELDIHISDQARIAARRVARDLFRAGLRFGTVFCHWMIKFSNPGSGTHCGSSFPMTGRPSGLFDSDVFGSPFGWTRVFVVDSSVLPSIPGTTLAFTTMANSYRIASQATIQASR